MARKDDEAKQVSKAFAYRDAEATLGRDADLDAVHAHILAKFGIDMKKTQISQYRTNEKKRVGHKGKKRGRKPKDLTSATAPKAASRGDIMIEFVSVMKSWENKI